MQKPIIDETKLSKTMKMIENAAALMAERDCTDDKDVKENLEKLCKPFGRLLHPI